MIFFHYSLAGGWCCCWAKVCQGLTTLSQFLPGLKLKGPTSLNAALKISVLYSMCEHWLFVRRNVPFYLRTLLRGRISYFWPPDLSHWGWNPSDLWISGVLDGCLVRFSLNMFYKQIWINLVHLAILFLILERIFLHFWATPDWRCRLFWGLPCTSLFCNCLKAGVFWFDKSSSQYPWCSAARTTPVWSRKAKNSLRIRLLRQR